MGSYTGRLTLTLDMFADAKDANEAVEVLNNIIFHGYPFSILTGPTVNAKFTLERVRPVGAAF